MSHPERRDHQFRAQARDLARDGLTYLARAINHCDAADMAYRYSDEVQSRLFRLAAELAMLVEGGAIVPNPAHAQHLNFLAARNDATLQSVIRRASSRRRIRG